MSEGDLSHLPPDLAKVVAEMRQRAKEMGELKVTRAPHEPRLSREDRDALDLWICTGGYQEAVAAVIAEDPELADQ